MGDTAVSEAISRLASEEDYEVEYSLRVLINSAVDPKAAAVIAASGGVEPLVPLLGSQNEVLQMLSAWALSNLAAGDDGRRAAVLRAGAVKLLVPILSAAADELAAAADASSSASKGAVGGGGGGGGGGSSSSGGAGGSTSGGAGAGAVGAGGAGAGAADDGAGGRVNADVLAKVMWLLTNLSHNDKSRKYLAACRVPRFLATLLRSKSPYVVLEVCKPLRNMLLELDAQKLFLQAGGLLHCVAILNSSAWKTDVVREVLNVLHTLSVGTDIMRKLIVAAGGLPPVVMCLSSPEMELANLAVQVLISLSLTEENEERVLQAGGILPIVDLFTSENPRLQEQAALLLSNLSVNEKIRENLRYCGVVPQLIEMLGGDPEADAAAGGGEAAAAAAAAGGAAGRAEDPAARAERLAKRKARRDAAAKEAGISPDEAEAQLVEQAARLVTNLAMDDVNRCELLEAGALDHIEPLAESSNEAVRAAADLARNNLRVPVPLAMKEQIAAQQKERQQQGGGRFLNPQLLRRERVANELLETERSYVSALKLAVELYLRPCMDAVVKDDPIIPEASVRVIFGVIEVIYKTNLTFLSELELAMATWEAQRTCIGTLLQDFTQQLKIYTRFINSYDQIVAAYADEIKTNQKFHDLIAANRDHPEAKGRDLMAFLIMPVQRVPRYLLLLEDLIRHTPATHADKAVSEQALASIRQVAGFLNESKRTAELYQRVVTLADQLEFPSSLTDGGKWKLVDPNVPANERRSFVREGALLERSGRTRASKYSHVFLLTDVLLHTMQKKNKYKVKSRIMLTKGTTVAAEPDTDALKNAFRVDWTDNGKQNSITLVANSPQEREQWLQDLTARLQR